MWISCDGEKHSALFRQMEARLDNLRTRKADWRSAKDGDVLVLIASRPVVEFSEPDGSAALVRWLLARLGELDEAGVLKQVADAH